MEGRVIRESDRREGIEVLEDRYVVLIGLSLIGCVVCVLLYTS